LLRKSNALEATEENSTVDLVNRNLEYVFGRRYSDESMDGAFSDDSDGGKGELIIFTALHGFSVLRSVKRTSDLSFGILGR